MEVLVLGGTRYFGVHLVKELISQGHNVTIATRQFKKDDFAEAVQRIKVDRTSQSSLEQAFKGKWFDVVYDNLGYCSNDIKILLDTIDCERYVYTSSTSVYEPKKINTQEKDFDAKKKQLIWCARSEYSYEELKRQAECALSQKYDGQKWVAVRYPFVIGRDDYTNRLRFYVENIIKEIPMHIDNLDCQMSFIRSDEAGKFLAFLVDKEYCGVLNGSSQGTISLGEIIAYVERQTNTKAIICSTGETAPYNGEPEYSINTEMAEGLGFEFSNVRDWVFDLVDYYINLVKLRGINATLF